MRLIPASLRSEREQRDGGKERSLLYLNVYDLTPINDYLFWFGLGIFHSGIEVHGMEYGFGAHDYPSSGVFEVEPRSCPGFIFRRSILLGTTDMTRSEYRLFVEQLASKYHGDTYHLIAKNCNHFTDEVCFHLTGRHIPGWVNRLARLEDESDSASIASLESEDDVEALDHHQLLTPTHPDVSFVKENSVPGKDRASVDHNTAAHSL
ncbi:hypothetical protein V2J09_020658 [Rumex salicifolius]